MVLLSSVTVVVPAAFPEPVEVATPEPTAAIQTVYANGQIYTQDPDLPWARSLVTRGNEIVFVGSTEEALHYAAEGAGLVDLQDQFVMPGIVDAHTHPGLIATGANLSVLNETGEGNEKPVNTDRMPSMPKEATLAWLQRYADDHPFTLDPTGRVGCCHLPASRATQERPG